MFSSAFSRTCGTSQVTTRLLIQFEIRVQPSTVRFPQMFLFCPFQWGCFEERPPAMPGDTSQTLFQFLHIWLIKTNSYLNICVVVFRDPLARQHRPFIPGAGLLSPEIKVCQSQNLIFVAAKLDWLKVTLRFVCFMGQLTPYSRLCVLLALVNRPRHTSIKINRAANRKRFHYADYFLDLLILCSFNYLWGWWLHRLLTGYKVPTV